MKFHETVLMAVCTVALGGLSSLAYGYAGEQYASQAKVTMSEARAKALKAAPGTIAKSELEKESGGSGLRYTFDIKTGNGIREVGIDAKTGTVLENVAESSQTEQLEKQAERHEGKRKAEEHENEQNGQEQGED